MVIPVKLSKGKIESIPEADLINKSKLKNTAPANATQLRLHIEQQNFNGNTWFDAVQVVQNEVLSTYNLNENESAEIDENNNGFPDWYFWTKWSGSTASYTWDSSVYLDNEYTYDGSNRQKEIKYNNVTQFTNTYQTNGNNLAKVADINGKEINYNYDDANRMLSKKDNFDPGFANGFLTSYTLDKNGNTTGYNANIGKVVGAVPVFIFME